MEKKEFVSKLAKLPLFAGLPSDKVEEVVASLHGSVRHYPKSDYICLDGDALEGLNVLISGSVHMIYEDVLGDKTIIDGLKPGYMFTEKYLGSGGNKSNVSFLVASDSEILYLPMSKDVIEANLNGNPFGMMICNLLTLMADNSSRLVKKNEIICKKTLREKILTYLYQQAWENHSNTFEIPFNRTDFASYLDSDRSALTRELKNMKNEGFIDFEKNTFTLLKNFNE